MGWMPAPLDISMAFNLDYRKTKSQKINKKRYLFDFNVGYIATVFLGTFCKSWCTCNV